MQIQGIRQARTLICLLSVLFLFGCQATGEEYQANVYKAGQVNSRQEARTVQILAVMPAKIEVENKQGKKAAKLLGGVFGALAGAAAGNQAKNNTGEATAVGAVGGAAVGVAAADTVAKETVLVDGVSLTYIEDGKTLNSAQVGRTCEFQPGIAIVISTGENETRIQPNTACPEEKKS
jgi:outer membrane lipoprotein SlyB